MKDRNRLLADIARLRGKLETGHLAAGDFDLEILRLVEASGSGAPVAFDSPGERFPVPVAAAYAHLDDPLSSWQNRRAALHFTVYQAMRMVALPLIGQYLRLEAADAEASRCFDKALAKLHCPHYNDWITLLHTARKYGTRLRLDLFEDLHPHGFREGMGQLADRKIHFHGQPWPLLEAFRELRNDAGHGGILSDKACRQAFDQFRPLVDEVLEAFGFLADCRLVAVLEDHGQGRQLELRGSLPQALPHTEALPPGAPSVHLLVPGRSVQMLFPFLHPQLGDEPLFAYDGHYSRRNEGGAVVIRYLGIGERREVRDLGSSPSACRTLQGLWEDRVQTRSQQLLAGGPEALRERVAASTEETLEALQRDLDLPVLPKVRPELEEPVGRFLREPGTGRALLVLGEPESGKSALLLSCLRNGPEGCRRVLLARGEWLAVQPQWRDRQLQGNLWALLGGDASAGPGPEDLLHHVAEAGVVLVLDGLDHSPCPQGMVREALRWLDRTQVRVVLALRPAGAEHLLGAAGVGRGVFAPVPGRRRPGLPPFLEVPRRPAVQATPPDPIARSARWLQDHEAHRPELAAAVARLASLWLERGTCRLDSRDGSQLSSSSEGLSDLEILLLEGVLRRETPADEPLYYVPDGAHREYLLFRHLFPGPRPAPEDARREALREVDHAAFPEYSGAFGLALQTWMQCEDLAALADFLGDPRVPLPVRSRAVSDLARQALVAPDPGGRLGRVLRLADPGSVKQLCLARTFLWDLAPRLRRRLPPRDLGALLAEVDQALRACLLADSLAGEGPDVRRSLVVNSALLAAVMQEAGDLPGAERRLAEAVDEGRGLVQARPQDVQARRDLVESLLGLGRLHLRLGRFGEAEGTCREALELAGEPRSEAAACSALAQVLWAAGRREDLRPVLARALRCVRRAARSEPSRGGHAQALHSLLGLLADLYRVSGRPGHAERVLKVLVRRAEELLEGDPGDEDLARSAAVAHGRLADLERELGNLGEAEAHAQRSLVLSRDLLRRLPESRPDRANMVGARSRLADLLAAQGKVSEGAGLRSEAMQERRDRRLKPQASNPSEGGL